MTPGRGTGGSLRPPRVASLLIRLFSPGDLRDEIATNIDRRFEAMARSDNRGARRWYWWQALRCIRPGRSFRSPRHARSRRRGFVRGLTGLGSELRSTMRGLARQPGFTAFAILTLGVGIGATTAIFSVVNGVLLRPLPYPESGRLVNVWQVNEGWFDNPNPGLRSWASSFPVSMPVIRDWAELSPVFDAVGSYSEVSYVIPSDDTPERVSAVSVTSGVWRALGVAPLLGRAFIVADDEIGAPPVAVINYGFWQNRLGGDTDVIGSTLVLNGKSHTVVGVMPAGFYFPDPSKELWTTFSDGNKARDRQSQFMSAIARLKPQVSLEQAQVEMEALTARLVEERGHDPEHSVRLVPRIREVVGDVQLVLVVLFGAVGLVLLIACANVASMLLVRATEQRRELAIRAALGAGRGRLLQQLLLESLAVSVGGGLLGAVLAFSAVGPLLTRIPAIPRLDEIVIDWRVLSFAIGASVATGLLAGVLPGMKASRTDVSEAMVDGGRGSTTGRNRNWIQGSLVCTEIALAFVLITGAGLLVKSFLRLTSVERGFKAERVLAFDLTLPGGEAPPQGHSTESRESGEFDEVARRIDFVTRLQERMNALPGVQIAAVASDIPFMGGTSSGTTSYESSAGIDETNVERSGVTPAYFQAMGVTIVEGRGFSESDTRTSEPVAIVSRGMAERYWPEESPVGWRLKSSSVDSDTPWRTIVGVAADVRHQGLAIDPRPKYYRPFSQATRGWVDVVVKTAIAPEAVTALIADAVHELDPAAPPPRIRKLEERIANSVAAPRFRAQLISSLAIIAALLAVVGVYGVLAYSMARRTSEIGIRMALGARRRDVLKVILSRGATLTGAGILIGAAVSAGAVRVLGSFLYDTRVSDPTMFLAAAAFVGAAGMLASLVPARRATRVDPVEALRAD